MKNKILLTTCLISSLLVGCAPSISEESTTNEPTTSIEESTSVEVEEREFRFQVIHDVDYYNGQKNYFFTDENGDLVANLNKRQYFFAMFRYSPIITPLDEIVMKIDDTEIVSKVKDTANPYLINKFRAGKVTGETTLTIYPVGEGIDSEKFTFIINIKVR